VITLLAPLLLATTVGSAPLPPALATDSLADARLCDRAVDGGAADGELARAAATATGPRAPFLRGCQRMAARQASAAADEFERAVQADPRNPVYHFWLGRAYGAQAQRANVLRQPGLARQTRGEFERAVALDPGYLDAREGLMQYYLQAPGVLGGSAAKAREQAAEIARRDAYRGGRVTAALARRAQDTAGVRRAYEGMIAQYPDSAAPYTALAVLLSTRRDWPGAWGVVDRLERARPGLPATGYATGRLAAESGQHLDRGERGLTAYLAHRPSPGEPSHAAAQWRLGMIRERRGDPAGARRAYEAALALDPKQEGAKAALARLR
jgi:tetratricopeptide (TPR) repeat protein